MKSKLIYAVADAATTISILATRALFVLKARSQELYLKGAEAAVTEAEVELKKSALRRKAAVQAKANADDHFAEASGNLSRAHSQVLAAQRAVNLQPTSAI